MPAKDKFSQERVSTAFFVFLFVCKLISIVIEYMHTEKQPKQLHILTLKFRLQFTVFLF